MPATPLSAAHGYDLMQYHENIRMEDPDRFFAEGGPLEALLEAKKAGKIRYIVFTGHKDPVVHLRMLVPPYSATWTNSRSATTTGR